MSTTNKPKSRNFAVGAVIIDRSSGPAKFLLLRRKEGDFMGGIDELPGGKAEGKESLKDALKREVREETSLRIGEITDYLGSFQYPDAGGKMRRQFNFAVSVKPGKLKLSPAEHDGYNWVAAGDPADSRLTAEVRELINSHEGLFQN